MARHEEVVRAHLPRQSAAARRAGGPQELTPDRRCPGAAAQLAAVHRTLRHGPALQLRAGGAADANRTGLPDRLKSGVEALSGVSLDGVKVHYNSSKPAQLNALAYAQGSDIHLAPGQEAHLPHEAWHVVQQAQGRVRPTLQMKEGVPVNDDAGLEHEADIMGARAMTTAPADFAHKPVSIAATSRTKQAQGLWKFFGSLFNRTPRPMFPGVSAGSGKWPLFPFPLFILKHRFSGYHISGSFEANPGKTSFVVIKYMELVEPRGPGFAKLFGDLEASAAEVGSKSIDVTFSECKAAVVEKIEAHRKKTGFDIIEMQEDETGTGPTIRLRKEIRPKEEPKQEESKE